MQAQHLPRQSPRFTVIHRQIRQRVELLHLPSLPQVSRFPPAGHGLHLWELSSGTSKL